MSLLLRRTIRWIPGVNHDLSNWILALLDGELCAGTEIIMRKTLIAHATFLAFVLASTAPLLGQSEQQRIDEFVANPDKCCNQLRDEVLYCKRWAADKNHVQPNYWNWDRGSGRNVLNHPYCPDTLEFAAQLPQRNWVSLAGVAVTQSELALARQQNEEDARQRAVAAADEAEELRMSAGPKPETAPFLSAGETSFKAGEFKRASKYFSVALRLDPTYPYSSLWLFLAKTRSGLDARAELAANMNRLKLQHWPASIINMFLGTVSPESVLSEAKSSGPKTSAEKLCEASFYIAEYQIQTGHYKDAQAFFQQSIGTGLTTFVEYGFSTSELLQISHFPAGPKVGGSKTDEPLIAERKGGEYMAVVAGSIASPAYTALFPCKPTIEEANGITTYRCSLEAVEDTVSATNEVLYPRMGGSPKPHETRVQYQLVVTPNKTKAIPEKQAFSRSLRSSHDPQAIIASDVSEADAMGIQASIEYVSDDWHKSDVVTHSVQHEIVTPSQVFIGRVSVAHRRGHRDPLNYTGPGNNVSDYPIVRLVKVASSD